MATFKENHCQVKKKKLPRSSVTKSDLTMIKKKLTVKLWMQETIFNIDNHSPARTVAKACTFIASLLSYVAEKVSLT